MIRNDHERGEMHARVEKFEDLLTQLRKTARPEGWPALSSGVAWEDIARQHSGVPRVGFHSP